MKKPDWKGGWHGQCCTTTVKVATGRRFPWRSPTGQLVWLPIKETRVEVQWTWDADLEEWMPDAQWLARNSGENAGRFSVSKRTPLERQFAERQRKRNAELRRKARKAGKAGKTNR